MSTCLCTFRALSRTRPGSAKTLTPFLYQTATIQQRSRRHAGTSSRARGDPEHDIPFEGEELPPAVDDAPARKTTITGSERAAFEKLYKTFSAEKKEGGWGDYETDKIADEYYEDDDDGDKGAGAGAESIDSIFDAVLSGKAKSSAVDRPRKLKKPMDLASLAQEVLRPEQDEAKARKRQAAAALQARIKEIRNAEKQRIRARLDAAPTDQAVWAILERDLFAVMRAMDLDASPRLPKQRSSRVFLDKNIDPRPTDPEILFPTFPTHLTHAAAILATRFPASPLVAALLPTLKALGRAPYALGATTALYKILLRHAFYTHHSYARICALLQDMDNGGIEYDLGVLSFLDEVLATHAQARKGAFGKGLRALAGLEAWGRGVRDVEAWREVIRGRLGVWSEDRREADTWKRRAKEGARKRSEGGRSEGSAGGARGDDHHIPLVGGDAPFTEGRQAVPGEKPAEQPATETSADGQGLAAHDASPDVTSFLNDASREEPAPFTEGRQAVPAEQPARETSADGHVHAAHDPSPDVPPFLDDASREEPALPPPPSAAHDAEAHPEASSAHPTSDEKPV